MWDRQKKNLFFQIGLHVASKHPELYKEIVDKYIHIDAIDENLLNIPKYRESLNDFIQIAAKEITINELRRLFTSAMLRIFVPGVYNQNNNAIVLGKYGFIRQLAPCLGVKEARASQIVRQSIAYEKIYDDFRSEVDGLVNFLTSKETVKAAC